MIHRARVFNERTNDMTAEHIKTEYVYPPIPIRCYDWRAWFGDYEPGCLQGYGETEAAAIDDLKEQAKMAGL
jgi:hypothetical protein